MYRYDNARADAASEALTRLTEKEAEDWKKRATLFRLQEWALHERMLHAADTALEKIQNSKRCFSLHHLIQIYNLAFLLGRRAAGMPLDGKPPPPPEPAVGPSWEEALQKIYGQPADKGTASPSSKPLET